MYLYVPLWILFNQRRFNLLAISSRALNSDCGKDLGHCVRFASAGPQRDVEDLAMASLHYCSQRLLSHIVWEFSQIYTCPSDGATTHFSLVRRYRR
jgi:hypothetical protein